MDEIFSSSSSSENGLSFWIYLNLLILRPILAIAFVLSFILLGWVLAWKLVLVHVPLVQEIFGLRKKSIKPKPKNLRRFSNYYSSIKGGNAPNSSFLCWHCLGTMTQMYVLVVSWILTIVYCPSMQP